MSAAVERVLLLMYPATREPDGTPMGDHQRRFAEDIVAGVRDADALTVGCDE